MLNTFFDRSDELYIDADVTNVEAYNDALESKGLRIYEDYYYHMNAYDEMLDEVAEGREGLLADDDLDGYIDESNAQAVYNARIKDRMDQTQEVYNNMREEFVDNLLDLRSSGEFEIADKVWDRVLEFYEYDPMPSKFKNVPEMKRYSVDDDVDSEVESTYIDWSKPIDNEDMYEIVEDIYDYQQETNAKMEKLHVEMKKIRDEEFHEIFDLEQTKDNDIIPDVKKINFASLDTDVEKLDDNSFEM